MKKHVLAVLLTVVLLLPLVLAVQSSSGLQTVAVENLGREKASSDCFLPRNKPENRGMSVAGTPHDPIVIDGDADFAAKALAEGWPGDGSPEKPYIIDGLDIDFGDKVGHCISISNTRVSFIVSRCKLTGATISLGAGIYLYNASNALLTNNRCTSNFNGICLEKSSYNTVANNTCTSNDYGIHLRQSSYNTVANNTCTSNTYWDIFLLYSHSNTVADNTCTSNTEYGIHLNASHSNTVANNTCNNNIVGIYLCASVSNTVADNTCTSNTEYGIHLEQSSDNTVANNTCTSNSYGIYLEDSYSNTVSDNTCTSNDYGIHLRQSSYNTVANNTCTSNRHGIHLDASHSNTVANNTCNNNNIVGISLSDSDSNTVSDNTCTSNSYGIYLGDSHSNTVADNTCTSSTYYGIHLEQSSDNTVANNTCTSNRHGILIQYQSHYNYIHWNVFADNLYNGRDYTMSSTFRYNFWSDYTGTDANGDGIGDTAYTFSSNSDPYPLMYQPILRWIEPPMDQSVEFEHLFHYELNILYYGPLICSISDTARFTIDDQGVVESIGILPIGDYELRVDITNIYRISITATFSVRVSVDASNPPGWLTIPIDQSLAYGEKFEYQLIAIDPSGIDYWNLNDTANFALSASFFAGGSTARITSNSVLGPGSYGLNITVYDIFGNVLSGTFKVTVVQVQQVGENGQLTDNEIDDYWPQIHDGMITWSGHDGNDYEVFFYDGSTVVQLTDNEFTDRDLQIHNGMITWMGHDGNDYEIFLYDGSAVVQLTDNEFHDYYPQIHNGMITWMGHDGDDYEIFLYDGSAVVQLTDNELIDTHPQIHNGMITWRGHDEIFLYDGSAVVQLTDNELIDTHPQIHNGMITWMRTSYDYQGSEIFFYDGVSVVQLTDNEFTDRDLQIHNGMITWMRDGYDYQDSEIFFYDGVSVVQLTDNEFYDSDPKIHNGMITWMRHDRYWSFCDVFLYDGSSVVQFTDNEFPCVTPDIHDGMVTWYSWDGNDFEIYLWGEPLAIPQLELKLSGEFDFLLKEEIRFQLAALLTDTYMGAPVSGATVTFDIYDPDGAILVSGTLVENMTNPGVYIYTMNDTMKDLKIPKGIYLVYGCATLPSGAQAVDMIQFHVDPPGAGSTSYLTEALVAGSVLGVVAVAALRSFRRRKTRLLSIPS